MKRWKCILRGIILLTLTAALLGGGAGGMTMTAQAKEAPARGNEGVERLAEDEKRIYDTLKTLAGNVIQESNLLQARRDNTWAPVAIGSPE